MTCKVEGAVFLTGGIKCMKFETSDGTKNFLPPVVEDGVGYQGPLSPYPRFLHMDGSFNPRIEIPSSSS